MRTSRMSCAIAVMINGQEQARPPRRRETPHISPCISVSGHFLEAIALSSLLQAHRDAHRKLSIPEFTGNRPFFNTLSCCGEQGLLSVAVSFGIFWHTRSVLCLSEVFYRVKSSWELSVPVSSRTDSCTCLSSILSNVKAI